MRSNPRPAIQKTKSSTRLNLAIYQTLLAGAAALLSISSANAQNVANNFTTGTDLTDPNAYSLIAVPNSTQDVSLATLPGLLTNNNSTALTMGSLDLTTDAYTIDTNDGGTSSITLGGGQNQVTGSNAADLIYMSGNSSLTLSNTSGTQCMNLAAAGNFDVTAGSTLLIGTSEISTGPTVAMGANALTVTGGGNMTISGNITSSGGLALNGGTLTLSGAGSTYTGGTTVLAGMVKANLTYVGGTGSVQLGAAANPIKIGASSGNADAGITFTHTFNSAGSPTISNPITVQAGSSGNLTMNYSNAAGFTNGFTTTGNITLNNNLTIAGTFSPSIVHVTFQDTISAGTAGNFTLTFNAQNSNTFFLLQTTTNLIRDGLANGTVAVDVKGSGKLQFNTTNSYSGGTTIENTATLQLQAANVMPTSGSVTLFNTAILNIGNFIQNIGALNSAATGTTVQNASATTVGTLVVNSGGSYAGKINNGGTGGVDVTALNLAGGMLILSGTSNTYTGGTTISGGVLVVTNASGSATGTGAVAVNGGAVAGTGTISGASARVTVNGGGAVAPGVNTSGNFGTAGTLHLNGGLTVSTGSQLDLDVSSNAASGNDLITTGALTLPSSGQATIDLNMLGATLQTGTPYQLISFTSLTGSASNLVASALPGYIATFSTTSNQLDVTFIVPEPASLSLLAMGSLAILGRRRRRQPGR